MENIPLKTTTSDNSKVENNNIIEANHNHSYNTRSKSTKTRKYEIKCNENKNGISDIHAGDNNTYKHSTETRKVTQGTNTKQSVTTVTDKIDDCIDVNNIVTVKRRRSNDYDTMVPMDEQIYTV